MSEAPKFKRILLKLSGEALMGNLTHGVDPDTIRTFAREIGKVVDRGVQVGLVIGGGNLFRGAGLAAAGIDRVNGDQMGMLATVMNGLAMRATLESEGYAARLFSAVPMGGFCESFSRDLALRYLEAGEVALFAGGTGNPFFTTDSAASLRAIEIGADAVLKATKVDGIYSADPMQVADAVRYEKISYDEALRQNLQVMDATAIVLCREHNMPLCVFNINEPGALLQVINGEPVGSWVEPGGDT